MSNLQNLPAYESLDIAFDSCIIPHAKIEQLWSGGRWVEGPAWFSAGRYLLWSDIPNNRIMRWDDCSGQVCEFRNPSNNTNGNSVDHQGRLLSCEHLTRRVTRTEFDGSVTVIADEFEGARLNSPNDVVAHSDGSIWFTDPDYGIMTDYEGRTAAVEQESCNIYRVAIDGSISRVSDSMLKPNGLALSPDESQLYASDTGATHVAGGPHEIRQFDLTNDGTALSGGTVFAECTNGVFDGFRFDTDGRLWSSAEDGVHCFNHDGKLIGKILLPEIVSNVTFGGEKRNRLFITATSSLYAVYLSVNGAAVG